MCINIHVYMYLAVCICMYDLSEQIKKYIWYKASCGTLGEISISPALSPNMGSTA